MKQGTVGQVTTPTSTMLRQRIAALEQEVVDLTNAKAALTAECVERLSFMKQTDILLRQLLIYEHYPLDGINGIFIRGKQLILNNPIYQALLSRP